MKNTDLMLLKSNVFVVKEASPLRVSDSSKVKQLALSCYSSKKQSKNREDLKCYPVPYDLYKVDVA